MELHNTLQPPARRNICCKKIPKVLICTVINPHLKSAVLSFLHFLLFSSCPLGFYCELTLLLSLSQCCQLSAAFSTWLRKTCTLRRTSHAVLPVLHCQEAPFFLYSIVKHPHVSVHMIHEFLSVYVGPNWHSWVLERDFFFGIATPGASEKKMVTEVHLV